MAFGISAGAWLAGAAVAGTAVSAYSANKAAGAQSDSAAAANATQQAQYDQTRADNAPWKTAGAMAIGQMSAGTQPGGQFTQKFDGAAFQGDPGYAFRLQQGQDALNNSAAARGGVLSGAQMKGASQYNQNFASNEYGNAYNRFNTDQNTQFNRLASVAGTGQVANGTVATAGMNAANQISGNQTGAGNAQASGYIGQANALSSGVSTGINAYNQNNMLNAFTNNGNGFSGYGSNSNTWNQNALSQGGSQFQGPLQ